MGRWLLVVYRAHSTMPYLAPAVPLSRDGLSFLPFFFVCVCGQTTFHEGDV